MQLRSTVEANIPITDANLQACLSVVRDSFGSFEVDTGDAADKIAKGHDFVEYPLDRALSDGE